ncbi:GGDEF domain-containing protein [Kineococcus sp. SYSU DK003]|uniref:GGDEF domain-containing protein n=1 Tax=Kineococcus sp. SYSU DK003 TaxID=3383124 RepID=UPI003D7D7773
MPSDSPSLRPTVLAVVGGLLCVLIGSLPAPGTDANTIAYLLPLVYATVVMSVAVVRIPAGFRRPWWWLLVSQGLYLSGELLFARLTLNGDESWPTVADLCYLLAYAPVAVGLLSLNRQRSTGNYRGSLLDAGILSLSAATLFGTFVVLPVAQDSTQPLLTRTVSSAYPVCDVLLIFLVARLVTGPGSRPPAFWLLVLGTSCTIVADVAFNLQQLTTAGNDSDRGLNALWLLYYVGFAAAAVNARHPWHRQPTTEATGGLTAARLLVLAVAAVLPSAVLTVMALLRQTVPVAWLAAGSVALVALVVARIWDLLQRLRSQSRQLESMARTDPLTGLPNRRTLEHELARACRSGRGDDVFVAMVDLDHFKAYNDSRGHQAGDGLLTAATAAWALSLRPDGFLARWGGEEFVVVVRGAEPDALARLDALRAVVPDGQTCSIGVARWRRDETPDETLRRADEALYAAKAAGRDRLRLAPPTLPSGTGPQPVA